MRATVFHGPRDVRIDTVAPPELRADTDAIVTVTHTCVCGSDLWAYRGVAKRAVGQRIGHEFLGVVSRVGTAVSTVRPGDRVLAPFGWSDGTCRRCRTGWPTSCPNGGFWGRTPGSDGAQAEALRVPHADGTLVVLPSAVAAGQDRALLALCDVLSTGHHAAASAGVRPGSVVAVVGDGAVGLCAVLAARRLGAARVVLLSRHEARARLGARLGAVPVPADHEQAVGLVHDMTDGDGADAVLECVGTEQSLRTAVALARDGGAVGFVGVPHGVDRLPVGAMFGRNVGVRGGIAPARAYIPQLLPEVLSGALDPGPVFDVTLPLDRVADAYALMDRRAAIKVMLTP
jgi:threonine dehydrogenase-like Zn-dependent dehydrogenase